jgi:hypothetical protein
MRPLGTHLGAHVSALIDGQLDDATSERLWSHVAACVSCRRLVESESWLKRKLAVTTCAEPSARLLGSLHDLPMVAASWAVADQFESQHRARRRTALIGAGSVSLALFGFAALSGVVPELRPDRGPTASIRDALFPSESPSQSTQVGDSGKRGDGSIPPHNGPVSPSRPDGFVSVLLLRP